MTRIEPDAPASDDLVERLRKAMVGVTPGPWDFAHIFPAGGFEYAAVIRGRELPDGGAPVVADLPPRTTHGTHQANAEWIALACPENIASLLDALSAKDAELSELRRQVDTLTGEVERHKAPPSVLRNCHIEPRQGDEFMFHFNGHNEDGTFYGAAVNLDGYAIVPQERLEAAEARARRMEEALRNIADDRPADLRAYARAARIIKEHGNG